MRLLYIQNEVHEDSSLHISLQEFTNYERGIPSYAVLSHRWQDEEVLFADIVGNRCIAQTKQGYSKLEASCHVALKYELRYLWCDTCCIDKSSSAELSEAINSMYEYYAKADLCITYLDDVESGTHDDTFLDHAKWFTRGWTLQELIAPRKSHFYSQNWKYLGNKTILEHQLARASGIKRAVLQRPEMLKLACVSEKMSWAAHRTTTRPEDRAYSLMGLFGIHMPPLYGEGEVNAFRRLQLQILQSTTDHTIFAWNSDSCTGHMLAPSVSHFANGSAFEPLKYSSIDAFTEPNLNSPSSRYRVGQGVLMRQLDKHKPDYSMTNAGLHIQLPMEPLPDIYEEQVVDRHKGSRALYENLHFAFLACRLKSNPSSLVAICLRLNVDPDYPDYSRVSFNGDTLQTFDGSGYKDHRLRITNFNPVWVRQAPHIEPPDGKLRWPLTAKRLHFEIWCKSAIPLAVHWSCMPTKQNSAAGKGDTQRREELPARYEAAQRPVQFCISGFLPADELSHEVIAIQGQSNMFEDRAGYAVIAFGVADRSLWMQTTAVQKRQHYASVHSNFAFPTGRKGHASGSTFRVLNNSEDSLFLDKARNTPSMRGEYSICMHKDGEEISLRIYLSPTDDAMRVWTTRLVDAYTAK